MNKISDLKPGMKVRMLSDCELGMFKAGDILTIDWVDNINNETASCADDIVIAQHGYHNDQFEIITKTEQKETKMDLQPKFNLGDVVRTANNCLITIESIEIEIRKDFLSINYNDSGFFEDSLSLVVSKRDRKDLTD